MKSNLCFFVTLFLLCFSVTAQVKKQEVVHPWKHLVLVGKTFGINANGTKLNYYKNTNYLWNDWLIPWGFGIHSFTINQSHFEKSGYKDANLNTFSIGSSGFKSLERNLYLNLVIQATLGNEKLKDFSNVINDRFVFGISPSQGIVYIPKSKFGVVLGLSVYEKILSSKVYSFDAGVQFSLGITF